MNRFAMISLLSFLFGCSPQFDSKPGTLYSVDDGEGSYRVAKVLVIDDGGVHIRLYKNKWKERPKNVDTSTLSLGAVDDKDGFGMGHLPLTKRAFAAWKPVAIGRQKLRRKNSMVTKCGKMEEEVILEANEVGSIPPEWRMVHFCYLILISGEVQKRIIP